MVCLTVLKGKAVHLELSLQEQQAVDIFDALARKEELDTTPIWADSFSSLIFLDLPGDGTVVDIGCGTGRIVPILGDLSIDKYVGIDPSSECVSYCKRTYPELTFNVGSIQTLGEDYPERFSGFILATSLMHVPRSSLQKSLRSLRKSLLAGAHGMISLPLGEPLTWKHDSGMTLTLYTEPEMERQLPLHGFKIMQMFSRSGHMLLIHVVAV